MAEPADEQPEEKTLNIKFSLKGARSVGNEPLEDGADPDAVWTTCVCFNWPGEEEPIESELVEGRGEIQYGIDRDFVFPLNQETYDTLATTTIEITMKTIQTQENPKTGEMERVEGGESAYGTIKIALSEFLAGKTELGGWMDLELTNPPPPPDENALDALMDEEPPPPPGLEVSMVAQEAVFTEEEAGLTNSLTLKIDTVYSLPAKWLETEDKEVTKLRVIELSERGW